MVNKYRDNSSDSLRLRIVMTRKIKEAFEDYSNEVRAYIGTILERNGDNEPLKREVGPHVKDIDELRIEVRQILGLGSDADLATVRAAVKKRMEIK